MSIQFVDLEKEVKKEQRRRERLVLVQLSKLEHAAGYKHGLRYAEEFQNDNTEYFERAIKARFIVHNDITTGKTKVTRTYPIDKTKPTEDYLAGEIQGIIDGVKTFKNISLGNPLKHDMNLSR